MSEKIQKERITFHLSKPLIERIKNCVYWTPGLTMAELGEEALRVKIDQIEKQRGGPFQSREKELNRGRPMK